MPANSNGRKSASLGSVVEERICDVESEFERFSMSRRPQNS